MDRRRSCNLGTMSRPHSDRVAEPPRRVALAHQQGARWRFGWIKMFVNLIWISMLPESSHRKREKSLGFSKDGSCGRATCCWSTAEGRPESIAACGHLSRSDL